MTSTTKFCEFFHVGNELMVLYYLPWAWMSRLRDHIMRYARDDDSRFPYLAYPPQLEQGRYVFQSSYSHDHLSANNFFQFFSAPLRPLFPFL
jgi:hypothetical protein